MQPDLPRQKRVATSLLTADRDFEAASTLVSVSPHLYETVGFHCQQATEKYLKAALVASSLPVRFTHDLLALMRALHQAGIVQFDAQELANASVLNDFAAELRYEIDDAPSYTSAELLAMAHQFQHKLRPLAAAFLI